MVEMIEVSDILFLHVTFSTRINRTMGHMLVMLDASFTQSSTHTHINTHFAWREDADLDQRRGHTSRK